MKLTSAAFFCYFLYSIPAVFSDGLIEGGCPSESETKPCSCTDDRKRGRDYQKLYCESIHSVSPLRNIFMHKQERYGMEEVKFTSSVLAYIPHEMFDRFLMDDLILQKMRMTQLFDEPPNDASSVTRFYMYNVTFQRNLDWSLLKNMKNLQVLSVQDATIKVIGESFKKYVTKTLERIYFAGTGTKQIVPGTFADFEFLESIMLNKCELRNLTRNMFPKKSLYLGSLYFDHNNISYIPNDLFKDMPALWEVSLRNNSIITVPESAFERSPFDTSLHFEDNPIKCSCALRWMFKLTESNSKPRRYGKCASPGNMENTLFEDLTFEKFRCEKYSS